MNKINSLEIKKQILIRRGSHSNVYFQLKNNYKLYAMGALRPNNGNANEYITAKLISCPFNVFTSCSFT